MSVFVNGQKIDDIIKAEAERMRPQYEQAFKDMDKDEREAQLLDWSKENAVEQVLLRQLAAEEFSEIAEPEIEESYQKALQSYPAISERDGEEVKSEIKSQLQVEKLVKKITANIAEPGDKAIKKYYERNIARFTIPEMVRASHIVLHPNPEVSEDQQQKELSSVAQEIKDGAEFEEMAAKYSDCPDNAGDLGYFARGKMVQEFEDVAFSLEVGEVSEVFKSGFGYHIVKLLDRKPSMPCQLAEVREMIARELSSEEAQKAIANFLDAEKAKAKIEEK